MKKLSVLLLALLLAGCGAAAGPAEDIIPPEQLPHSPGAVLQEPEQEVEQALFFVVELDTISGKVATMDDIPLVEYSFQVPEMKVQQEDGATLIEGGTPKEEAAIAAAAAFNERFARWRAPDTIMSLVEPAEADLKFYQEEGLDWRDGYTYDMACTAYQTEGLVSISGTYYAYTGGAHPNTYLMGWNFDLKNGVFMGAEALVGREDLRGAVEEELLRQARERAEEEGSAPEEFFWPEYETILADWPSYAVTFDAEGMTVAFSPYELAAYAAGAQVFRVSYDLMRPYMDADGLELLGLEAE